MNPPSSMFSTCFYVMAPLHKTARLLGLFLLHYRKDTQNSHLYPSVLFILTDNNNNNNDHFSPSRAIIMPPHLLLRFIFKHPPDALVLFIPIHLTILEVLQSMILAPTIFLRLLYILLRNHPCPSSFLLLLHHHHPLYIPPLPLTLCTLLQYLNRSVPNVSNALRSEFARGDGRIKRKEDDRRRKIQPSETLFVVNFHEETTKREDLQMLFEPFGELVRIDSKCCDCFIRLL